MVIDLDFDSLFSDTVFFRAQQYADTKRVDYLGVNRAGKDERSERYFFSVSGSNNNEYTVTIRPGEYRGGFEASCTCPYEWDEYCKHIGAAIITGVEEGVFSLTDYSGVPVEKPARGGKRGLRTPRDNREAKEELLFDLSKPPSKKTKKKVRPSDVLRQHDYALRDTLFPDPFEIPEEAAKAPQKFLLVFFVENRKDPYGYRYASARDPLAVTPGAQYIKKDGSPGRYESYRDSQTFLPITDSERSLLTWLLDSEPRSVPLGYVLPHLVNDGDLRIVMRHNNSYLPVSIEKLQAVGVSFEFEGLLGANEPAFRPWLVFESQGMKKDPVSVDAVEYGESGIGLYFYTQIDSIIYYTDSDTLDTRYLARILRKRDAYTIDDALSVSEAIDSSFLKIDPPKGKILIRYTKPELALYLDARNGGILVHPAFSYGTQTVDMKLPAPLLVDIRVDDTLHVHWRDFKAESLLLEWFRDLCSNDIAGFHMYALQMDIPEFLFRYGEACFNAGVRLLLKGDNKPIRQAGSFNIIASSGIDWLDLKIRIDDHQVSPKDIDLLRGTVAVNGEYRLLDKQTLERLRVLYQSGKQGKESIQLSRFDLAAISEVESLIEADDSFDLARIRSALAKFGRGFSAKQLRRPKGMVGTLRPYQKSGVKWLQFLAEFGFGGILADDMGLGKTVQAIALFAHLAEQGVEGPYLVVAPVSTISNWIREIEHFAPGMPAYAHIGSERPADTGEIVSYRGVVVTSYHTLQRDIELFEPVRWSQVILDESQVLKNPTAKSHKTVRQLHFDRVLAMSGTPVENSILELWSIMSILNPGLLGSKTDFMKRFRKRIADGDKTAIETLRAKLRPFLLRRTKEQVAADLPAKEEVSIDVCLSPIERSFYDGLKEKLREEVRGILMSDEPFRAANVILTALTKLRQAAIAPSLVGGPNESSKLDAVIEKLDEGVCEGHKILVFSQYVRILQMLKARVERERWAYCYLDGSISAKKRKAVIDEFQNNPEVSVFLISLKAGGVGINLTEADYVFLVDPWWNPAVESQAIDRTHRIGQKKPVFAYRFISEDTIEHRILELQETKRELVRNVIGGDASMFKSLSKDEIIGLFE